jgi:MFS family permease
LHYRNAAGKPCPKARQAPTPGEGIPILHSASTEWKRSWPIVAASIFGLSLTGLSAYAIGAFVEPLEAEFGWSRARITSGVTMAGLLGALLMPLAGLLIDRVGPRRIAVPGTVLLCAAIALLSLINESLPLWIALWSFVGLAMVLTKSTVWLAGISSAFDRSRGLAIGIGLSGGTLTTAIAPLLATYLVGEVGWRIAYICLAAAWGLFTIPIVFLWFRTPADDRQSVKASADLNNLPGMEFGEAVRSPSFIMILTAGAAVVLSSMPMSTMMIPILTSNGMTAMLAAQIAALLGVTSVIGRIGTGYFLDKFDARYVGAITFAFPIISCLLLLASPGSVGGCIVAVLFLGLCLGAEFDCSAYLSSRYFGLRRFGTIYGIIAAVMAGSVALSPLWINFVYDTTGSYRLGLWICIPIAALGSIMLLSLDRRRLLYGHQDPAKATA